MIVACSKFLFFVSHHAVWSMMGLLMAALLAGVVVHRLSGSKAGYALLPFAFVGGMLALFTAHFANAAFVHAVGTPGTAVIVDRRDANMLLNDQPVSYYDTLVTTASGAEVLTRFTEMSAAIYPMRNEILIPPLNERFVVKYVPGDEGNIVIMSDESDYGQRRLLRVAEEPVKRARRLYEASPANPAFISGYREALQVFLSEHAARAPAERVRRYRDALDALGP